jgi:hypothetical protein
VHPYRHADDAGNGASPSARHMKGLR